MAIFLFLIGATLALATGPGAVLIAPIWAVIVLVIYLRSKSAANERLRRWSQQWYCSRCGVLFVPERKAVMAPVAVVEAQRPLDDRRRLPQPSTSPRTVDHSFERLRASRQVKLCERADGRSSRLGLLQAGTEVTVLDRRPGWLFVQDGAGVEGWARDEHWARLSGE